LNAAKEVIFGGVNGKGKDEEGNNVIKIKYPNSKVVVRI
jgi:hypothetical protein